LNDEERRAKYEKETAELYAAIGRFAVQFEHVCHAMTETVQAILHAAGLKNQRLGWAVLAGLTAEPLRAIFGATLAEVRKDADDLKIIGKLLSNVQELTSQRNDMIHRTWFVGWATVENPDFSTVGGIKYVNTKAGTDFRTLEYTCADFDALSQRAEELTGIIRVVSALIGMGKPLVGRFSVDPHGAVRRVLSPPDPGGTASVSGEGASRPKKGKQG